MTLTWSNAYDYFNALSYEHRDDPVDRVRYAGYAVMMHDLLAFAPLDEGNLRKICALEGLTWPLTPSMPAG